jgi:hypothetical protein
MDSYGAPQRDDEGHIVAWHGFAMAPEDVVDVVPPGTPPVAAPTSREPEAEAAEPEQEHAEHAPPV